MFLLVLDIPVWHHNLDLGLDPPLALRHPSIVGVAFTKRFPARLFVLDSLSSLSLLWITASLAQ